ncbi:MAG: hypothetical protein ACI8S3_000797 [Alphaproteobacteria bacterium]|jgi:hypothetical protein
MGKGGVMKARIVTPAVIGAVLGGIATFGGTQAANYYFIDRAEATEEMKDARAQILPLLDPLPKTPNEVKRAINALRAKRILFQDENAKNLFALAIGHLDEIQEELVAQATAERERRLQLAKAEAASGRNDVAAADEARRAAALQAEKAEAARLKVLDTSRSITKIPNLRIKAF